MCMMAYGCGDPCASHKELQARIEQLERDASWGEALEHAAKICDQAALDQARFGSRDIDLHMVAARIRASRNNVNLEVK